MSQVSLHVLEGYSISYPLPTKCSQSISTFIVHIFRWSVIANAIIDRGLLLQAFTAVSGDPSAAEGCTEINGKYSESFTVEKGFTPG